MSNLDSKKGALRVRPPNRDAISSVVDGLTGREYSRAEFERLQSYRKFTRLLPRFVKGPIPVPWMARAFRLRTASAWKVALGLFYQRGLAGGDTFKLEPARFLELGIDETARRRGLKALAREGLIHLQGSPGACPVVTLIFDAEAQGATEGLGSSVLR